MALTEDDPWCYFEWRIGEANLAIPDDVIARAWGDFNDRLIGHHWRKAMLFQHR